MNKLWFRLGYALSIVASAIFALIVLGASTLWSLCQLKIIDLDVTFNNSVAVGVIWWLAVFVIYVIKKAIKE